MSFFNELKRRNVFKVGVAYVVGGWLLLQLTDVLSQLLDLPEVVGRIIVLLVAIGLPVALFFAWAFEMTPDGVRRETEVDRSQSIAPKTGKKLNNAILVLMALAIGYLLFDRFSGQAQPGSGHFSQQAAGQSTDAAAKSALTPIEATAQAGAEAVIARQSIAVLPFDNRSRQEDDEFFVEGMHDDLLTNLARISALKVISRTSVLRYKNTEMPIPAIAAELGVATIMEGAVQRSGNAVRINVQLIDANTDEHLWAEIYDRELTAENLFAIQSEISQAIADELQATLTPDEKGRINAAPTENLKAHDAFLRGRQLMATRESRSLEQAVLAFKEAVALDPKFALAWVGLADTYWLLTIYGSSLTAKDSLPLRQDAVNRALEIDDKLGEAYASQAHIYFYLRQYDQAEEAILKAIALSPNYALAWMWYSNFLSDFPLRVQEAVDAARKAAELDPTSAIVGQILGTRYERQGLYSLAERQYLRAMELEPDFVPAYRFLADFYQFAAGQYAKALPLYEKAYELDPGNVNQQGSIAELFLNIGDIPGAEKIRQRMLDVDADSVSAGFLDVKINLLQDNPAGARETIGWLLPKVQHSEPNMQWLAMFNLLTGDKQGTRDMLLSAIPGWAEPAQWQGLIEHYAAMGCFVSWLFMNTGDEQMGSDLLAQTTRFLEHSLPSVIEHSDAWQPDVCYLTAGDNEKALASIETQLSHNHLSNWLHIHDLPMYDAIRFNPRYRAAVEEHQKRVSQQREAIEAMQMEIGT